MEQSEIKEKTKPNKKKIILSIVTMTVILLGLTYAIFQLTLNGTKENVLTAGTLALTLDDTTTSGINITSGVPITDEEGKASTAYTFTLENTGNIDSDYTIYLDDIDLTTGQTRMPDSAAKYYLTKNGDDFGLFTVNTLGANPNRVLDSGRIKAREKNTYTLRVWINYDATNEVMGTTFKTKLRVEAKQKGTSPITKKLLTDNALQQPIAQMFNYTSEGTQWTQATYATSAANPTYVNSGLYESEDDDGKSYYFRGNVNNIVKFGTYEKDYYVYRHNSKDFPSLAACQWYNAACTESNKTLKYTKGTPIYWKIIRTNGDGTTRMIYAGAGTTMPTTGQDTGIGYSCFNNSYNDIKYIGYTYDNGTASPIKTEIDNWYNTNLKPTTYDTKIAKSSFCSDSSGAETGVYSSYTTFSNFRRNAQGWLDFATDNAPSFKCPTTTETYGGKYNLKAGLLTTDEVVAAGAQYNPTNKSYYLYNNEYYWTMTPAVFRDSTTGVWIVNDAGTLSFYNVYATTLLVRPVINLRADAKITSGSGTTSNPYTIG